MAGESFDTNLLRMIAAELWLSLRLQVARDLFGKGYLSLSAVEKSSVDQVVFATIAADFQTLTPDFLQTQKAGEPVGFQAPAGTPTPSSPTPP